MNVKDTLTKEDLLKWAKDTVVFCALPTLIVFLQNYQTGNFQVALGAAQVALISAVINLLRKYSAGVDLKEVPEVTPVAASTTPGETVAVKTFEPGLPVEEVK